MAGTTSIREGSFLRSVRCKLEKVRGGEGNFKEICAAEVDFEKLREGYSFFKV